MYARKRIQHELFPQTTRDWNDLPESLISSSELSDDSASKFTCLVRSNACFLDSDNGISQIFSI